MLEFSSMVLPAPSPYLGGERDIHIIISITILSVLCAIGLYLYCRRRNTNDCLHLHVDLFVFHNSRCVDQNTSTSTGSLPTHYMRPSPSAFRPTTLLSIWDASVRQAFHLESSSSLRLFDIFRLLFNQLPSVLWHCWLGGRKGIHPVKSEWWGTGVVICLEWGANDLHVVQLMPLPPHRLLLQ